MVPPQFIDSFFKDLPSIAKIIWILATVFFFVLLSLILFLKVVRFRLRKKEAFVKNQSEQYEIYIVDYLYACEDCKELNNTQEKLISQIKLSLTTSINRKTFVNTLLKLKGEVSGNMIDIINQLYKKLELDARALSKLKSSKWHIVAIGIRDLRRFKVLEGQKEVAKYINHPKTEVRRQAYLYFINLFGFKGLDFLDNLKSSISVWDRIGILDALQEIKSQNIPDARKWLTSKNDYVVLLALELIRAYNLRETQEELLQLIQHENKEIRLTTIHVLNYLYITEAKELLINTYENLTEEEQIVVFELLENMGTKEEEPFVLKHVTSEVFEIKVLALKILKQIDSPKFVGIKNEISKLGNFKVIDFLEKTP
ncbi:HEAT repeat domain-containing protein [Tenacibaculum sp. SDUM215027]|uniref:HEAT repeat domain-containing protein n=1 Tax=Tenacibaculum sp. SDUM215027 TaxID=3422596 RepID=UPI003D30F000